MAGKSQTDIFRKEWAFGPNGGFNYSRVHFFPSVAQDMLQQHGGGISIRHVSENHFGIQGELNYSLHGWKEKTDTVTNLSEYSRSLAYIEMPVMTYLYFNMGKRARLVFLAGPQIGYNIGEKILKENLVASDSDEDFERKKQEYYHKEVQRPIDYGITGGMGFELRTGVGNFILDGRYYFGLSDFFNNKRSDYFQASSNQFISVKMTYLFEVKSKK